MYNWTTSLIKFRGALKLFNQNQNYNFLLNSKLYHGKPKVLITRSGLPGDGINKIKEECDTDMYEKDKQMPRDEIIKRIPGKDGLYCLITENIDKDIISAGDQLKVISTASAGYDHIDLEECRKRNVLVSNAPHISANCVAEWTVMLMLCAGRRFPEAAASIKKGQWTCQWRPSWLIGKGLEDSVVGIVGMSRIGQCIMNRVFPFGVNKVLYHDIQGPIIAAEAMGAIYADFDDLIKESDFIVAMCNLTDKTKNLFNKNVFDRMKSTAIFVNTSRGEVVNQEDLYDALKYKIQAAAIDVTVPEPLPPYHKLNSLSNLIITPHLAGSEKDAVIKMVNLAAENILLGVKGQPLVTPVTMSK